MSYQHSNLFDCIHILSIVSPISFLSRVLRIENKKIISNFYYRFMTHPLLRVRRITGKSLFFFAIVIFKHKNWIIKETHSKCCIKSIIKNKIKLVILSSFRGIFVQEDSQNKTSGILTYRYALEITRESFKNNRLTTKRTND